MLNIVFDYLQLFLLVEFYLLKGSLKICSMSDLSLFKVIHLSLSSLHMIFPLDPQARIQ